jgi:predicted membrane metal-binding protein
MAHGFWHLLAVSAVVMGMAQTISKEQIFLPLRERLGGKETWLGYLVSCPYCASHWLAFVLVPLTGAYYVTVSPRLGPLAPVLDWFLSSILVVVVAAFLRVAFWLVDEEQGLIKRRQRSEEEVAATRRVARARLERTAGEEESDVH